MARIRQPFSELSKLYRKDMGKDFYISDIHRAYERVDGKFVPIGWSILGYDIQRSPFQRRVYTDVEIFEMAQEIWK